jgi:hypothetical protein
MDKREQDFIEPISAEEIDGLVWSNLLEWLNSNQSLPPDIKELFVERSTELRLRFQALFIEIQRRFLNQVAAEAEFEDYLRRDIRENVPYMNPKEKLEALKTLTDTTENRMKRLEAQLAGFDFFNTVQVSVQSMSDTKVRKDLTASVKAMPTAKRQQLLSMLNDMVKNVEPEPMEIDATIIDTPAIPPESE